MFTPALSAKDGMEHILVVNHYIDIGISVPTRLVESVGEHKIRATMRNIRAYDLYSGVWTA